MTDASEADDQAAVPGPRSSGDPRDTSATTAPGAASADSSPASASAGAGPDANSTDTSPDAISAGSSSASASAGAGPDANSTDTSPDAASAGSSPDAGTADGGAGRATAWGVADTRRAEMYVRLLAENELRVALAFPRIKPPPERPGASVAWAAVEATVGAAEFVTRPVRPAAVRAWQAARPWAESAAKVLSPPARLLAPPARRAGAAVSMAGWRARAAANWIGSRWTQPSWQDDTPSARTCLHRVQAAASALATTGAVGAKTARSVADNMELALVARDRIEDEGLLNAHLAAALWHQQSAPPPPGPVRAIPIGATVDIEAHDERGRIHLLALVLADRHATVTMVARQAAADYAELGDDEDGDVYMIVDNLKIYGVDDRGGTYRLHMESGGGSDLLWEGQFSVAPVPPPGIRWLEITVMPGQAPIHIDLPPVSAADVADADPAGRTQPSVPDRAERIIDMASQRLLDGLHGPGPVETVQYLLPEIADQVQALQAVGALTPGSPALARLLELARRRGCRIPAELPAAAEAAGITGVGDEGREDLLPEAWRTVLELIDASGGLDGSDGEYGEYDDTAEETAEIAPAAAVLPELDGARCVVTGLRGGADQTAVKVLAWGWPRAEFGRHKPAVRQFRWLARDDTGRWHVGYEDGNSYGEGATEFELMLMPPVDPAAASLELMLLGLSGEVSATLPLNWMER